MPCGFREIGRLGFSPEVLTPAKVIDLTIYACTDATCQPGGRPVNQDSSAALAEAEPAGQR